jgi:hypothetical protein
MGVAWNIHSSGILQNRDPDSNLANSDRNIKNWIKFCKLAANRCKARNTNMNLNRLTNKKTQNSFYEHIFGLNLTCFVHWLRNISPFRKVPSVGDFLPQIAKLSTFPQWSPAKYTVPQFNSF